MSVFLLSYHSSTPTYGPAATRIRMPALAMPPMVSPRSFSTRSACRTCAGDMPAGCCRSRSTICCRIWERGRGRVGQRDCGDGGGFGGAADSNPGWPIRDFHIGHDQVEFVLSSACETFQMSHALLEGLKSVGVLGRLSRRSYRRPGDIW
jgi:hypothetical protein